MHACFLSNGYGEDKAASMIADSLRRACPDLRITGAPMVTSGEEYVRRGFPVLTHGKVPPSGGFPLKSLRGLLLDILHTPSHLQYYRRLRDAKHEVDHAVAVGDIALLVIAHLALRRPVTFVELAKSSYKGPHFRSEIALLRRLHCSVITRDACTRDYLLSMGVEARFLGNPMMDGLTPRGVDLGIAPVVGILPGSRHEAYANLRTILSIVERAPDGLTFVCAKPSCLSLKGIEDSVRQDGWKFDGAALQKSGRTVFVRDDAFADIIMGSRVVIGLAGSANEQAVGVGTPVISFAGVGAQTTVRRMLSQQRLLGESVKFVRDVPGGVVEELSFLLAHPKERERRGMIGMQRMGPPGGSDAIARFLAEEIGMHTASQMAA